MGNLIYAIQLELQLKTFTFKRFTDNLESYPSLIDLCNVEIIIEKWHRLY